MAEFLADSELDTVICALLTTILTGLLKIPVKHMAEKSSQSKKITRFITFMPVFIGFGITVLKTYLLKREVVFEEAFFMQWLSVVSISLAIYAFWEKFVPSEKAILSEVEINANKAAIEKLKTSLTDKDAIQNPEPSEFKKIILTNNRK